MIASTQTHHPLVGVTATAGRAAAPATPSPLDEACPRLKAAGLRITQPRIAILTVLLAQAHPISIDQIFQRIAGNSCDLVTVYRCLGAFEEVNLVRRSFSHNGTSLYAITLSGEISYNVRCKKTHSVETLDPVAVEHLREAIKAVEASLLAKGYTEISHSVEFFGLSPHATPPSMRRMANVTIQA